MLEHASLGDSLAQDLGGHVEQIDAVSTGDDGVRDRLVLRDPRERLDGVIEAVQMLNIEIRDNVDARVEQLVDILPALIEATARHVAVGQLVNQRDRRPPRQQRVEVHLRKRRAVVGHPPQRNHLEPADPRNQIRAVVRLDHPDQHVNALLRQPQALIQHRKRLANPRRGAEVDVQPAPASTTG
jgi:hypothetical protein